MKLKKFLAWVTESKKYFPKGNRLKRDLRKYAKSTNVRLLIGFILILFVVGDGLIYLIYGRGAAITGFLCLVGGMLPIVLIFGILFLLEAVARKANEE